MVYYDRQLQAAMSHAQYLVRVNISGFGYSNTEHFSQVSGNTPS